MRSARPRAPLSFGLAPGIALTVLASPWGPIHLAVRAGRLCAVSLGGTETALAAALARRFGVGPAGSGPAAPRGSPSLDLDPASARTLAEAARQIEAYLHGRLRAFELPLDLTGLAAWDRRVLRAVTTIPFGAVTSYGRLARAVGAPRSGRAVGGAVGRNPFAIVVPCHRVIAADGSLGGYGGRWPDEQELNLARKRALLAHEGVGLPPAGFFEPPQLDGP